MRLSRAIALFLAVGIVAGCGGGGAPSNLNQVQVFLTDDLNTGYDHVWATVLKISLVKPDSSLVTVFENASGQAVDLRALNNGLASLFAFAGGKGVPAGTYNGMQVVLGQSVVLYPTGATTGTSATFAGAAAGQWTAAYAFSAPQTVPGTGNFVIDFDLAHWTVAGSTVTAIVKEGSSTGIDDPTRQSADDYTGVVSSLSGSAPNYTFVLTTTLGNVLAVKCDSTTGFFAADGSSPSPADGRSVTVRGAYSASGGAVAARYLRINSDGYSPKPRAFGVVSAQDANAGTFTVVLGSASGFVPATTAVKAVVDFNTTFFTNHCTPFVSQFDCFAAMAVVPLPNVEVEGTYDVGSNTLHATVVRLDDSTGAQAGGYGYVVGAVVTSPGIDVLDGTFTMSATAWSGSVFTMHANVNVVTTGSTVYTVSNIASNKATFFSMLTVGTTGVRAVGAYNPVTGTLTADRLFLN